MAQATVRTAAELIDVHRNTTALYYHKPRQCVATPMAGLESKLAVFECHESYFDGVRNGKRGRGHTRKFHFWGGLSYERTLDLVGGWIPIETTIAWPMVPPASPAVRTPDAATSFPIHCPPRNPGS